MTFTPSHFLRAASWAAIFSCQFALLSSTAMANGRGDCTCCQQNDCTSCQQGCATCQGGSCQRSCQCQGDFDGCCPNPCSSCGGCGCARGCRGGDDFDTGAATCCLSDRSKTSKARDFMSKLTAVLAGDCRCGATHDGCLPNYCGLQAPAYPVPFATPQHVGWHYFTYAPMMPHHSLPHYRHTYAYKHGPGLSRTTVNWTKRPITDTAAYLHHLVSFPH